jgi:FkbM family methyltransferase
MSFDNMRFSIFNNTYHKLRAIILGNPLGKSLNYHATNQIDIIEKTNNSWKLSGKRIRIERTNDPKIFVLNDYGNDTKIYFSSISRALWMYEQGLVKRGEQLAKSYALDQIEFGNDDIIIDCGANYGDLNIYFDSLGVSPLYYGIEPSPLDFECLHKNWSNDSRKELCNYALADESGMIDFYIDTASASSSIIRPPNAQTMVKVQSITLDSFIRDHKLAGKKITLLKLEAEGAEPEICRGASQTLSYIKYIAADLGPERGLDEACTAPEVINTLLSNGFRVKAFGDRTSLRVLFENTKLRTDDS